MYNSILLIAWTWGVKQRKTYHQNVRIVTFTHRCMKFFCKTLTWLVTWSAKKKSASLTCKRFLSRNFSISPLVISSIYWCLKPFNFVYLVKRRTNTAKQTLNKEETTWTIYDVERAEDDGKNNLYTEIRVWSYTNFKSSNYYPVYNETIV
jgi:hypothetical protein